MKKIPAAIESNEEYKVSLSFFIKSKDLNSIPNIVNTIMGIWKLTPVIGRPIIEEISIAKKDEEDE